MISSAFLRLNSIKSMIFSGIPQNKQTLYNFSTSQQNITTNNNNEKQNIINFNYFKYGSHMIPHPEKVHKGGEDALYVSNQLLCVADGVGGWADYGVDPGLYSKSFCKHLGILFEQNKQQYLKDLKSLLRESHTKTKETGSTTVCVTSLDENQPVLNSSYIGDSGYVIYRKTQNEIKTVFISEEQQKSFNFPYQIGSEGDNPSVALKFQHQVQQNDLIVMGTDGLFDNIDEKQILNCISPLWEKQDSLDDLNLIAQIIAKYAYKLSLDPIYNSPFAKKAYKSFLNFRGGKSDDITVVVAQVQLKQ